MPQRHRDAYPPEFRYKLIELVRAGRSPDELAKEFEPTAQTIRNWVAQAERDSGHRNNGLSTEERDELAKLRRENKQLRIEREILSKARATFRFAHARDRGHRKSFRRRTLRASQRRGARGTWRARGEGALRGDPPRWKPRGAVNNAARKAGVDLIIVGRRQLSGSARLMMRSLSSRLLEDALCPVLVVHEDD